jgi:serine phosphatase RsbU (regulator of sigma subunit)
VAAACEIRGIIADLVRSGTPLHSVFATATKTVGDRVPFAAALLLHVDRPRWRLGYLSAGHPCALIRRPDGPVESLDGVQHPPIGVPYEPSPLTYVDIEPGTLVLAYTDGLVERRERSIVERIDLLAKSVAGIPAHAALHEALRSVVDEARRPDEDGDPIDDDVAAVLLRI